MTYNVFSGTLNPTHFTVGGLRDKSPRSWRLSANYATMMLSGRKLNSIYIHLYSPNR